MTIPQSYRAGSALYGDDFDREAIVKWFGEEELGYFDLADGGSSYDYGYHALNRAHAFRHLKDMHFARCLALGCARGDELLPLEGQVDEVVALEPAEQWWSDRIGNVRARYLKPVPSGDIPLDSATIDLITCFGVLHHIPNVSHVVSELARVAKPGAFFLLREPNHSMGDWRKPRRGLTRNERGIPEAWLEAVLDDHGFQIERKTRCMFNPLTTLLRKQGVRDGFNSPWAVRLDALVSRAFSFNLHYWRDKAWKKLGPSSSFYVLRKLG